MKKEQIKKVVTGTVDSISHFFFSCNENELRLIWMDRFPTETINVTSQPEIGSKKLNSQDLL